MRVGDNNAVYYINAGKLISENFVLHLKIVSIQEKMYTHLHDLYSYFKPYNTSALYYAALHLEVNVNSTDNYK